MKKILFTFLILATTLLYAQEQPIMGGVAGGYAIYKDTRFGDPVYLGVCYTGNDKIMMRSYEPGTGNDVVLLGTLTLEEDELAFEADMRLIKGALDSSDAAKRLYPMVLSWANSWYGIRDNIGTDTQLNGSSGYQFQYWIPVFQLTSIGPADGLSLVTVGVSRDEKLTPFMDFKGLPKPGYSPSYNISAAAEQDVEIDGVSIPLDKNWGMDEEKRYTLSRFSSDDASLTVQTVRPADSGISSAAVLALLKMMPAEDELLLAEGSKIFITDGIVNLVKRVYNGSTQRITTTQMQILGRGNGYVTIIELKILESVYSSNKAYFDAILY